MYKEDLETTDRLDDREELKIGYHPILKELHHKNAMRLDATFKEEGYDILKKMDEKTKEATFIIIQHAISDPLFMKEMYDVFKNMTSNYIERIFMIVLPIFKEDPSATVHNSTMVSMVRCNFFKRKILNMSMKEERVSDLDRSLKSLRSALDIRRSLKKKHIKTTLLKELGYYLQDGVMKR